MYDCNTITKTPFQAPELKQWRREYFCIPYSNVKTAPSSLTKVASAKNIRIILDGKVTGRYHCMTLKKTVLGSLTNGQSAG
jgi:hypothetical protein